MSGYDSIPIAGLHGTTVYVHVCLACGALVLDRHRHDPYHAATRTTPPDPHHRRPAADHTGGEVSAPTHYDREEMTRPGHTPEPPRVPTPVHRPDGRIYRPRKLPAAMLLGYDEIAGVCVVRTHSLETATNLALAALRQYDNAWPWELSNARCEWGHWRPTGHEPGERAWERDETGRTGQAAVFFDVEQV